MTIPDNFTHGLFDSTRGIFRHHYGSSELDQILKMNDVVRIAGHHRCTIYRWMHAGKFPKQHSFKGQHAGWRRSEIERWLAGDSPPAI